MKLTRQLLCFPALAALLVAAPALGSAKVKAFPAGCWIGTHSFTGTFASGPVQAKVTNGTVKFVLWVGSSKSAPAVGFLTTRGIGAGGLKIGDSELALEVKILGDYDLTGSASAVKVNGTYSMTGTAQGTGQFGGTFPVNIKVPVKGALLTIQTVTARRVTGLFVKSHWSATRRAGAPSKRPDACANAA